MARRVPSPVLQVDMLGRLAVRTGAGRPVNLGGRHAAPLFALLVLARRPRSREAIAADLWPDADGGSVATLRQALWLVRHGLSVAGLPPDGVLDVRADAIGLREDTLLDLDVERFERCLDDGACGAERAIAMYQGDFVEGLGHDCFARERERLADRYEDALTLVAVQRARDRDDAGARAAAERVLDRDPLREEAHAVVLAVLGRTGSRSQVLRHRRRLEALLARELGEPPLPETELAYREALQEVVRRSAERVALLEEEPPRLAVVSR